jgi:hypothetical protein
MGPIHDSRTRVFVRDRLMPTMRIIAGQRAPDRSPFTRLFPVKAEETFEHAVHWSAQMRYLSWREEGLTSYEPMNMNWAWPQIRQGRIRVVEFSDEADKRGRPWAASDDAAPVQPKRRRSRRTVPQDPEEKPVPLQYFYASDRASSSRRNVSRVETSATPSTHAGRKWRWKAVTMSRVLSS